MRLQSHERYKVAKNFYLDEFVPEALYRAHINNLGYLLTLIKPEMFAIAQELRDRLGTPLTINNWATGGNREWSGIRTPNSPYFSQGSRHSVLIKDGVIVKKCDAFDAILGNCTAEQARNHISKNFNIYRKYGVSRVEANVSWLHVDCKHMDLDYLYFFKL